MASLVFSGLGPYSAMADAVRRRTQEIVVRLAPGARSTHVRWLLLETGVRVVAGGLVLGVPASRWIGRLLRNKVVRTDSRDPVMFLAMVAVLAILALVAAVV